MKYRDSPRLKTFAYRGRFAYFVTSVTRGRRRWFSEPRTAEAVVATLLKSCERHEFRVIAYCVMPDHIHALVLGENDGSNLKKMMRLFKQTSSFQFHAETGELLWRISYHDRVLRGEEAVEDIARYIWANPLRAGLVSDFRSYPYSGPQPLSDWI
jgi:putative transposase